MYSQYEEEPAILGAVEHIENGRLLDLGAFHPTTFSNSRALIEKGWSAVLVEASPEPFLTLLKEYGNSDRVMLVNVAIGTHNGLSLMHATADAVSTIDPAVRETWKDAGGYYGKFITPVIPLVWIDSAFDFVNIDVEGGSVDLLGEVIERYAPTCICVEHDGRQEDVRRIAQGYRVVYENGTNMVLARSA